MRVFKISLLIALVLAIWLLFSYAQAQGPDLVPLQPTLSPSSAVEQGRIVRVSATVVNEGTAPADGFTVEISWRRTDKEELSGLQRIQVPGLEGNERLTVQAQVDTANLTPGTYEIAIRVDSEDQVAETDETNNRALLELTVLPPKPELHPLSLGFDPPSPVARGETVRVSAELENTGESTAGEFQVVFLYRQLHEEGWHEFGATLVPGLKQDEHLRFTRTLDTSTLPWENKPEGTVFEVKIIVDPQDRVVERDETNNELNVFLTVRPSKLDLPELHPVDIAFNRDLPLEWGRDLRVTVTIVNTGGSQVTKDFAVDFFYRPLGAAKWHKFDSPTVSEGLGVEEGENSVNVSATLDAPGLGLGPGSYEIRIAVDPDNKIDEQNEYNNELVLGFSIEGSELHPLSLELGAAPVHQGDTLTVTVQIENSGAKPAPRFTVGFFIDNLRFATFYYENKDTTGGLRQGEKVKAQGVLNTTDLPPGEYTLRVVVDPENKIPEPDEANNTISMPLRVLQPPPRRAELHPTRLIFNPPSPIRGGQVLRVAATIWNTGNIDATGFQVSFAYRQKDGGDDQFHEFAAQELSGLARGSKQVVSAELDTAGLAGDVSYELRVIVDPHDQIAELDEENNSLLTAFKLITPPLPPQRGADLVLRDMVLQPGATISQGGTLQVCVTVLNQGQGSAGDFRVEFRYRRAGTDRAFAAFSSKRIVSLAPGEKAQLCASLTTGSLSLGAYELELVVDPDNRVGELDEGNNTLYGRFTVTRALPRPDLYPVGLSFDPPSPVTRGQRVQVCVKVANMSAVGAGSFVIAYSYFMNGSYIQFASAAVSGLGGGEQLGLCRVLDTSSLAPGVYEIKVEIDATNQVAEQNEANNELTAYLTVTIPGPPAPQLVLSTGGPVRLVALDEKSGTVYVASADGRLYALERDTRPKPGFPFAADGPIKALLIDTGAPRAAYVGTADRLYAVSLNDGHEICNYELKSPAQALGVDRFGAVYVGTAGGLFSLDTDCQPRWEGPAVSRAIVALALDSSGTIYAASGSRLFALDRAGTVRWSKDMPAKIDSLVAGEAIYLGLDDGETIALGPGGGRSWSFAAGGPVVALALDRARAVVYAAAKLPPAKTNDAAGTSGERQGAARGELYALSLTGQLGWSFATSGALNAAPAIDGRSGALFLGADDGQLYTLRADGTELFTVTIGSPIRSTPVIDAAVQQIGGTFQLVRRVYFGTEDKNLYLIRVEADLGVNK